MAVVRDVFDGTVFVIDVQMVVLSKTPGVYNIVGKTESVYTWPPLTSSWYAPLVYSGDTIKPGVQVIPLTRRGGAWVAELPGLWKPRRMPVGIRLTDCNPVEQLPQG